MAKIEFTRAPEGLIGKPYKYYRDWLENNFFNELCSYCLLHFPSSLHIEHHEPQGYAPDRKDDPTNLLLGCPRCNSGKLDYHPKHNKRRRLSRDTSGHRVIDIREEDFSDLFELKESGEVLPKDGDKKNAQFLISLNCLGSIYLNMLGIEKGVSNISLLVKIY